uniref:Uncharacterized protein n=1 Tax=Arundo donax TaxID=35708 RepID=A0A0A9AC81_ARUDO
MVCALWLLQKIGAPCDCHKFGFQLRSSLS